MGAIFLIFVMMPHGNVPYTPPAWWQTPVLVTVMVIGMVVNELLRPRKK